MDVALVIGRLLLAAVFAVAGLAKAFDRAGSRQVLVDFGVPATLARPMAVMQPLVELAVAVALIPSETAWWGAVGTLALLLLFTAGIGLNLARGRKPNCRCFGQIAAGPVGWSTLVRNGALAAVAAFVVWQGRLDPGPNALSWLGGVVADQPLAAAGLVGLVILAIEAWLLFQLLLQNGRLMVRIEALEQRLDGGVSGQLSSPTQAQASVPAPPGLPVGSPAPSFALPGVHGETLTLDALRSPGKPVLLLFTDPNCGPCNGLMPDVGRWQREHAATLTVASISRGPPEESRPKSVEHGLTNVLLQRDYEVADAYKAHGTPAAVLVRPDGTIGSPVALGADAIREFVSKAIGVPAAVPTPPTEALAAAPNGRQAIASGHAPIIQAVMGQRVPALKLPDLDGKNVDLAQLGGARTLVLFWNPACGFCQQMLPDLKAWEASRPKRAPKLLVVSSGEVEVNRAMGLKSPVLLDQGFAVGTAFGATGTPMAVLVDARGRIASPLAAGADQVMPLAKGGGQAQVAGG
jgi:peroxiredoxin/uncharacterized membrane protein YphA (DoxX/SURF4 family)